jgi:NAD(P)-dependent dehydrogenase (short-subunit alcohol dehydrogenase family)
MELGGKSASLMFPDCDVQKACERAVFWTIGVLSGQGCALPTRLLVHADIYDEVLERLQAIAAQFKVGDPTEPGVMVGPVINAAAVERVMGMFDRVRAGGNGRFLIGGNRCGGALAAGNFIEPTIIVDVDPDSEVAQVEVFGPALVVMKFHDEDEAVAIANNSEYGLAAYIQSNDLARVHRLSERLNAGGVYVNGGMQINANTPFGGVDILVNNAALMVEIVDKPLIQTDRARFDKGIAVNLWGAINCAQVIAPLIAQRGGGAIVNQVSAGAFPAQTFYGVTKIALLGATTALATELGPQGIRVNAIGPGMTKTDAGLVLTPDDSPLVQFVEARTPIQGRDTPDALCGALLLLVSEAGRWMTGQVLNVDGGWVMRN